MKKGKDEDREIICDSCENKIAVKTTDKFPYEKGWSYIHELSGKKMTGDVLQRYKHQDKHFCSKACEDKFIEKRNEVKKDEN